jgi:hypothetical protein
MTSFDRFKAFVFLNFRLVVTEIEQTGRGGDSYRVKLRRKLTHTILPSGSVLAYSVIGYLFPAIL